MHELTEAYEGAKKALKDKKSSPMAGEKGSTYKYAHSHALPQKIDIFEEYLDEKGRPTTKYKAKQANAYIISGENKIYIQKIRIN